MVYLLLGSNIGDRLFYLEEACRRLENRLQREFARSVILETEAIGFDGPPFLNMVVAFETALEPEALLDMCQEVEVELGRARHTAEWGTDGRRIYSSRVIDIDILKYGNVEMQTPRLTIPHPQVESRPFVATLLEDIDNKLKNRE
ncbi:MAG: 2-amino-4-hydroxy-6-hydroxymethyldihydropteridine diphosphokinase [Bacteroidales bacterium]|nr:2-amino-4-hydroxy-6-hydroxymethyldihydropteridine diphosphokinase [Bacteroidales bacterium]